MRRALGFLAVAATLQACSSATEPARLSFDDAATWDRPEGKPLCAVDTTLVAQVVPVESLTAVRGAGGWAQMAASLPNMVAVFRGTNSSVSADGRLDIAVSGDSGRTWPTRSVAVDGPFDDRNQAIGFASDGRVILVYTALDAFDSAGVFQQDVARFSTFVQRSSDLGRSWTRPQAIDVRPFEWSSGYGRIQRTVDGSLLVSLHAGYFPVYSDSGKTADRAGWFSFVLRSRDGGATWGEPEAIGREVNEAGLAVVSPNLTLAAVRDMNRKLYLARRETAPRRWRIDCQLTADEEHPGDLLLLRSGMVLLTFGLRHPPYGVGFKASADSGRSWSPPSNLVVTGLGSNVGYPSTLEVGDELLTSYYADVGGANGFQLRFLRYRLQIVPGGSQRSHRPAAHRR